MNILVIGGGGREHAVCWKIAQSPLCKKLYCAPGNAGIAEVAECVALPWDQLDFESVVAFCREKSIDLVVIGPERPLADGLADATVAAGFKTFGPTRDGAQLEASKKFAKELMAETKIPTGAANYFTSYDDACAFLKTFEPPYVIKACGLAEGKGVTVAANIEDAEAALDEMLRAGRFGDSGAEALIEEYLDGEEASILAFTDGKTIKPMLSAQDHKRLLDGDAGPNTGGMGAYSPAPVVTEEISQRAYDEVLLPCLEGLKAKGIHYCGVVYAGLMITKKGPEVVEFNARLGDPEIQAVLPLMENDLVEVMLACCEGRLDEVELKWKKAHAVNIVAASGGYPGSYEKGKVITGLEKLKGLQDAIMFHAGTKFDDAGKVVTNGGRVMGITVMDEYLRVAIERGYELLGKTHFDGMHARTDIGRRALERLTK